MNVVAMATHIAAGGDLPPGALDWLRVGFRRFLRGDASLVVSLRLTSACKKAIRNRALLRAAELLDDGRNIDPWPLAGEVFKAIEKYGSATRRENAGALPPIAQAIREAKESGAKVEITREQINRILKNLR